MIVASSHNLNLVVEVRAYAKKMNRRFNWDQTELLSDEQLIAAFGPRTKTSKQAIKAVYRKYLQGFARAID